MKEKFFWIFCIVLLPLTVAGRTVQLLVMTEPVTGFFRQEYAATGILMGVLLGVCLAALLVCSRFSDPHPQSAGVKSLPLAFAAFLLAAAQLYEAATVAVSDRQIGLSLVLNMLLLFGSVAFFAMLGISRISDLPLPRSLTVLPVLLWIYKVIYAFTEYTGMANIAENILTVAALCFSLLFMLQQGKFLSGDLKKSSRWLTGGGICTAVLCAASTLPRYIVALVGESRLIHEGVMPNPADLALCIYILVFLFCVFPPRSTRSRPTVVASHRTI